MQIRKSVPQDLDRIMEIYAYARQFMAQHGNPNQWGPTNWPPEALIRKDIAEGSSYVCENEAGKVIGTFFFTQGPDIEPTYREITDGNWLDKSPYGVVHRIASDGSEKGTGAFCINWAYDQCGHLRMDTHGDNTVMQNLLLKLGFIHCGTIYVQEDSYPRLAYEKSEACMGERNMDTFCEALLSPKTDRIPDEYDWFAPLLGDWDCDYYDEPMAGKKRHVKGEWIFRRILEGSGIQDIFIFPSRGTKEKNPQPDGEYGTSLRIFNRNQGWYDVVYTCAGTMKRLCFRKEGEALAGKVLDEEATFWIFSDITENSFHWEYVTLNPDGSRNLICEIFGRRIRK